MTTSEPKRSALARSGRFVASAPLVWVATVVAGLVSMTEWGALGAVAAAAICVIAGTGAWSANPVPRELSSSDPTVRFAPPTTARWTVTGAAFALAAIWIAGANAAHPDGVGYTNDSSYALAGVIVFLLTGAGALVSAFVCRKRG